MSKADEHRHEQYEENRGRQVALEVLLKSNGWKDLKRVVEEQIRLRRQQIASSPLQGLDAAFKLATAQGEIAGMIFALGVPEIVMEDLEADIQVYLELKRQEEHDREKERKD